MALPPAEIFKVLSVESRIKIIELLKSHGPLGAKEIGEKMGITTAAVSQHLKILKHAGIVQSQRKGFWIPYAIDAGALDYCRQVLSKVCTCGCQEKCILNEMPCAEPNLNALKQEAQDLKNRLSAIQDQIRELESGR